VKYLPGSGPLASVAAPPPPFDLEIRPAPGAGLGLWTKVDLNKGTVLGEYTGGEGLSGGAYCVAHSWQQWRTVDAEHIGNEFRFVNDYGGLADT
jgi:hypothetical protein